jgi:hypothetical protein
MQISVSANTNVLPAIDAATWHGRVDTRGRQGVSTQVLAHELACPGDASTAPPKKHGRNH